MKYRLAIAGGTVVAMDAARSVARRTVLVDDAGQIAALAEPEAAYEATRTVDATGMVVTPGLVQTHVHLCQTLFRGLAEDRPLLPWLRDRIWPLEAAHDTASLQASARLGIAELLLGGTTCVLDMGTVHHTDALFESAAATGIRYVGGKAMMDTGEGVPRGLLEKTAASLRESDALAGRWHGAAGDRLRYAYAPRFILSCTEALMRAVAERTRDADGRFLVHTHASEQQAETEAVRSRFGMPNVAALAHLGLAHPRSVFAHCVWPEDQEVSLLAERGARVAHCPSSNLKLASGIAPVAAYLSRGVSVGIGSDGAPCSNLLDGWEELRLAALLAKLRDGAAAIPARRAFELATLGGARSLGLDDRIGSIEHGKRADLAILDLRRAHAFAPDAEDGVYTQLVYGARAADVRAVVVDGAVLVEDGRLTPATGLDLPTVLEDAARERARVLTRAVTGA